MNISHHIERAARLIPDHQALIFEGQSWTYHQLNQQVNRLANGLKALGLQRGERVGLFLPNIPEFIFAYLATLKLGAIAVSLNVMLKTDEVRFILHDCTAKIVITTEELSHCVPDGDLPELETLLIAEGEVLNGHSLAELMSVASPNFEAVEMDRHAPAVLVYTSGTTGFPKGATLSHGNVVSNMYAQMRCCGMTPSDKLLLYLPLFHCFGQNAILNSGLNACATIILQRRFKPETVIEAVQTEQITMFFGVPAVFIRLLELEHQDFSSVRYYFCAAASLPVEVVQRWQEKYGQVIYEGYGMTEASPCSSYNHDLRYKLGSIGMPIENVEMKIVDYEGHDLPPGEIGEIVMRGPNVMLGYWNLPFETAQSIKNGWLHSGDLGYRDQDGYFYLVDRLKDMINVSGFKVYPREVENVIYQHYAVAEVAVYGVPDPLKGETVWASIVLLPEHSVTPHQMAEFCAERMAAYKLPHTFKFVDALPKSPTGKILKRLLKEQATSHIVLFTH